MENVDTGADQIFRVDRRECPQIHKFLDGCAVGLIDHKSLEIGHHHVDQHLIQHLQKAIGAGLARHPRGYNPPGHTGHGIALAEVVDR